MKLTWKKGKPYSGMARLPETHLLRLDGEEVAVVQRHREENAFFWYGAGRNTANRRLTLEEAKAEARAYILTTLSK